MKQSLTNQSGFGQWIIFVVLLLGIGIGVWVAQIRTNVLPQAAAPVEIPQQTSMQLSLNQSDPPQLSTPFTVNVSLRSDLDAVRLISSQIKYDPKVLKLLKVETPISTISAEASPSAQRVSQWLETLFDNKEGKASITAVFAKGDFKTEIGNKTPFSYVKLIFSPLKSGSTELLIEDTSVMLRSIDNANILNKKENLKIEVIEGSAAERRVDNF